MAADPKPPLTAEEALAALSRIPVPKPVSVLLRTLHRAGEDAFLVGGWVRDALLQCPAAEFDVATSATPDVVQRLFRRTIPTGIRHGTVTVLVGSEPIPVEVTTFRGERGYHDGRHPDQVAFLDDVRADLARRDFTVNAFAYDPLRGIFLDEFEGLRDLTSRILRAIGDPLARFREDGLRPMRAVRFCATLEFALDPATAAAIPKALDVFDKVAVERMQLELYKLLAARLPSRGLLPMYETGLWGHLLPVPPPGEARAAVRHADELPPDPPLRLAALLTPTMAAGAEGEQAVAAAERLRLPRADLERIRRVLSHAAKHLLSAREPVEIRRCAVQLGRSGVEDALAFGRASNEVRQRVVAALSGAALDVRDLTIRGGDLVAAGILEPGPEVGACLRRLLDAVVEDPSRNRRDWLLERAAHLARRKATRAGKGG